MILFTCPCCFGDGKETCDNPDHGFITACGGEIGRLGCPVCGHDEKHKVPGGGSCEICNGKGKVTYPVALEYCCEDLEDRLSYADENFYEKFAEYKRQIQIGKMRDIMKDYA